MALILAIEPDRRQASQLTAIVRGRLHAELVLGESAERALAALGHRVPDLVLTSALLSPKDETALGERLRSLDGAAAYVQTLTIPVLASGSGRGSGRAGGVLSALRREKPKSAAAPDGCDPAVFAEQCQEYLERAAAERALAEKTAPDEEDLPPGPSVTLKAAPAPAAPEFVEHKPEGPQAPADADPQIEEFRVDDAEVDLVDPADLQGGLGSGAPSDEPIEATPIEAVPVAAPIVTRPVIAPQIAAPEMAAPIAGTPVPQPIVKPRAEHAHRSFRSLTKDDASGPASLLAAVAALEAEEQVKIEPIVATISEPTGDPFLQGSAPAASGDDAHAEAAQGEDDDELDLSSLLDGQSHNGSPGAPDDFDSEPVEVYELDTTLLTTPDPEMGAVLPRQNGRTWPVLEELATAPAVESTPAKPADARDDMKQWMDIIEALKRDAEPLASKQPPPVVNVEDAATAQNASDPGHHDAAAGGKKKRKRGKGNPAQDEWGFFDPDQCGFAALIEKLEEITDKDDTPTPKRA